MRTKLIHKIEHQMSRHHLFLLGCLLGSLFFWYVGLTFYSHAKVMLSEARDIYTSLNVRITEEKSVINELKTYCSGGLQTIIAPLPELPYPFE